MSPGLDQTKAHLRLRCGGRPPHRWNCVANRTQAYPATWVVLGLVLIHGSGCGQSRESAVPPPASRAGPAAPVVAAPAKEVSPEQAKTAATVPNGPQLFGRYCAACHGENGDGNGLAARFLYPKPRNFREGHFRLVTTTNRVPSDEDLMRVVVRGMPGSAMFPMGHLGEADRKDLVAHVRRLIRDGLEDQLRKEAKEFGEELVPAELAKTLDARTQPGSVLEIPAICRPPLPSQWHAAASFISSNVPPVTVTQEKATACRSSTTRAACRPALATSPEESSKGDASASSSTRGSSWGCPEPRCPRPANFKPAEVGDLINYIQSLSDASTPAKVEHRRTRLTAMRAKETLPEAIGDAQWDAVTSTPIVVSPLWWRDYGDPDLRVQAVHDGQTLAIRLSWRDETRNTQAIRPQDFTDMAALQLFKGEHEPFLGMGAADGSVDVWLWNGAAQADQEQYADVDTAYPNMAVDQYPFEGPGRRPTRPSHGAPAPGVCRCLGSRQSAVRPEPCPSWQQPPGQGIWQPDDPPAHLAGDQSAWRLEGRPLDGSLAPAAPGSARRRAGIGWGRSLFDRLRPLGWSGARPGWSEARFDLA